MKHLSRKKSLFPAYIVFLVFVILLAGGCKKKDNTQPAASGYPITIHKMTHHGVDHGRLSYMIKAPIVEQDAMRTFSLFSQGLMASIYNEDNNIEITASYGNLNSTTNTLILPGSTSAKTSDGVSIVTDYLQWSQLQNALFTQKAVIRIKDNKITVANIQNSGNMHEFNLTDVKLTRKDIEMVTAQAFLDTNISKAAIQTPITGTYTTYTISAAGGEYDMKAKIFELDMVNVSNSDNTLQLQAKEGRINTADNSSDFSKITKLGIINNKNTYDVITDKISLNTQNKLISASSSKVLSGKDTITSSKLNYFYDKKIITFDNNVKIVNNGKNKFTMECDLMSVNTTDNIMSATGKVKIVYKDKTITGNKLDYNSPILTIYDNVTMISTKGEKMAGTKIVIDTDKDTIKTTGRSKARVVVE